MNRATASSSSRRPACPQSSRTPTRSAFAGTIASAVIAKAVQRALDAAPSKVIAAAGGPQGIAERVFRTLHLEEGATAANVLAPALAAIPDRR